MRSKKSYVAFETLISVAINTTLSAGFVYLVFHRQTLIESHHCRMERKARDCEDRAKSDPRRADKLLRDAASHREWIAGLRGGHWRS